MNKNQKDSRNEEANILTFHDGDGKAHKFEYVDVIEYEGKEYIFLLPAESDSLELIIMEIEPVDEENENYLPIDDEEVLQAVYALFKEKYKDILSFSD